MDVNETDTANTFGETPLELDKCGDNTFFFFLISNKVLLKKGKTSLSTH
jgi:phage antirepressor YoqD-like protein